MICAELIHDSTRRSDTLARFRADRDESAAPRHHLHFLELQSLPIENQR